MNGRRRIAYVIGFSAPPVLRIDDFIRLLQAHGWDSYVILSPTAATWVVVDLLAEISGHPVRVEPRTPGEQDPLPPADAVFAAPITFNSLNKWAAGISDTLALGLLNEALGLDVPVTAVPCVNEALRLHPAYTDSVSRLTSLDVRTFELFATTQKTPSGSASIDWLQVLAPLLP